MKKIIPFLLVFFIFFGSIQEAQAQLLGVSDPQECKTDPLLPTLVICGRNQTSAGACSQYTKPCTLPDLVSMGSRLLVWLITAVLLIIPIIIMWTGAQLIYQQDRASSPMIAKLKKDFKMRILYFILMLAAWIIVRTVVDIFQVDDRVPSFLIDENGNAVKARQFDIR